MYRVSYSVKNLKVNKPIVDRIMDFNTFREAIDFVHMIRTTKSSEIALVGKPLVEELVTKLVKGKVA